jgi:hypothetical protein
VVISHRTAADIHTCFELYASLNDYTFMDVEIEKAIHSLMQKAKSGKFVRMRVIDNKIVAWICAELVSLPHSNERIMQQTYYASNQSGTAAYRSVLALHAAMEEEAVRKGCTLIASPGSHLDERFTFAKILEKNGWSRRGYLAIKSI